ASGIATSSTPSVPALRITARSGAPAGARPGWAVTVGVPGGVALGARVGLATTAAVGAVAAGGLGVGAGVRGAPTGEATRAGGAVMPGVSAIAAPVGAQERTTRARARAGQSGRLRGGK